MPAQEGNAAQAECLLSDPALDRPAGRGSERRNGIQADLYDGSEKGEKVYATTAYVGRSRRAGFNKQLAPAKNGERLERADVLARLDQLFRAGFPEEDAVPVYELAFLYFENGVSRRLYIDYGEFAIRGSLKEIAFPRARQASRPA